MTIDYQQATAVGIFITGIWGLSLVSLTSIRKSEEADTRTKDAAAVAIIAVNIVGAIAGAASAGYITLNIGVAGAWWGAGIFSVPFLAALFHYCVVGKKKDESSPNSVVPLNSTLKQDQIIAAAVKATILTLQTQTSSQHTPRTQEKGPEQE